MNVNFGLFPEIEFQGKKVKGRDRKRLYTQRAEQKLADWKQTF